MFDSKLNPAKIFIFFSSLLLILFTSSCKSDTVNSDAKAVEASVENTVDKATNNVEKTAKKMNKKAESLLDKAEKEMNLTRGKNVFNLSQVDTPALFDVTCQTASNPGKCSDKKMLQFIKDNAEFPKNANANIESLEQVIVVIDKDGNLSETKFIASGNNDQCKACQQAAANVIGKMKKWTPAMKDGKPVAFQMTIPVKFGK